METDYRYLSSLSHRSPEKQGDSHSLKAIYLVQKVKDKFVTVHAIGVISTA